MAPAQSLATDEEEGKLKIVVKLEESNGALDEKEERDGMRLVCESNFEDSGFYGDSSTARDRIDSDALDQDVDVVGVGEDAEVVEFEKGEDPDATEEQSSSFGNTFSGSEDEVRMSLSDVEVDSQFAHTPTSQFAHTQFMTMENEEQQLVSDGFSRLCRKKKVTVHWRRFISPLMWRCQWLELRMNELRSQALVYDKELAAYKREKQLQCKMIELDDSVSRSVPLSCQRHRKRAMKRRRRKRIEDTYDVPSYMSNHSIFSYYENKRSETDCQSVDNDYDERGMKTISLGICFYYATILLSHVENLFLKNSACFVSYQSQAVDEVAKRNDDYEWALLGLKDGDESLEKILLNLDSVQSRVLSLKTQLSEVICRNSMDISSSTTNILQGDPPISYDRSLSCSPDDIGDIMAPNHEPEYELEVPESAVSSYGDAADVDMIECTVGLLSADASLHQRRGKDLCKDLADDVLINNQAAEEELKNFEQVIHGGARLQEVAKEEAQSCSEDAKPAPRALIAAPTSGGENGQASVMKPCYTGKKRGRKPKKKRRGCCTSGLKSERIQRQRLN